MTYYPIFLRAQRGRNTLLALIWLVSLLAGVQTSAGDNEIRIQYLSTDLIYLDHGRDAGLEIGDLLTVMDGRVEKARLKVSSVAGRTAACTLVSQSAKPSVGDLVVIAKKASPAADSDSAAVDSAAVDSAEISPPSSEGRPAAGTAYSEESRPAKPGKISGTVSLQYYQFIDEGDGGSDFSQPGLRLNIKGRNLFGDDYSFRVRTRLRYNQRQNEVNEFAPETEWRNRIYEASFNYENPNARLNYRIGRIISDKFSGIGYIDGGQLAINLNRHFQAGTFAGSQPEWQSSDVRTSLKKYGFYGFFQAGSHQTQRFESTLAWAGEYHGSTVNREFAYVRNRYSRGNRLYFYQSAEIEINRDWRRERTGKSWELTNLYAYGRFQVSDAVNVGLSYDDRKNYYTYELLDRDERYFDEAARTGIRGDLQVRFSRNLSFSGSYGTRKREGDPNDSNSFQTALYWRNILDGTWSLNFRLNGFNNATTEGISPSLRVGKRFSQSGNTFYLGYSTYDYQFLLTDQDRRSQWYRLETYLVLNRRFFCSGQLEYNLGDDAEGYRAYLELGYRL